MVTARQVTATERLILSLERRGLVLDERLKKAIAPHFRANGRVDERAIYDLIFSGVMAEAGSVAALMWAAVSATVGSRSVTFADPDLDELGRSVGHVTETVAAAGKPYLLAGAGSVLKDYSMGQVRASVATNLSSGRRSRLVRIANVGACEWCAVRDGQPAPNGRISHHRGCVCYVGVR